MAPPTHPTLVSALEIVSRNKRVREAELRKGGDAHADGRRVCTHHERARFFLVFGNRSRERDIGTQVMILLYAARSMFASRAAPFTLSSSLVPRSGRCQLLLATF